MHTLYKQTKIFFKVQKVGFMHKTSYQTERCNYNRHPMGPDTSIMKKARGRGGKLLVLLRVGVIYTVHVLV